MPMPINKIGIHYPVLVIPPTDRIPVETLRKIQQYVAGGGKAIAVGRAPSSTRMDKRSRDRIRFPANCSTVPNRPWLRMTRLSERRCTRPFAPDFSWKTTTMILALFAASCRLQTSTSSPIRRIIQSVTQAAFATTHNFGQRWDADTGTAVSGSSRPRPPSLSTWRLTSLPFLSSAIHLRAGPPSTAAGAQIADLSADWKVTFTGDRKTISEHVLADWTSDPATRFYSGEAVYERDFTLSKLPAGAIFLDVEGGTAVTKPDQSQGTRHEGLVRPPGTGSGYCFYQWPPRGVALASAVQAGRCGFLKQGQNHIGIKVYNTAINAWAALPPHDYQPLIAKYGDRFQMQDLDQVKPVPSGLLGTIHLVSGEAQE